MLYESIDELKEDLEEIESLFPSAAIFGRISTMLRDSNADLMDLVQCIEMDPAMAADVIRLSNSTFYGFPDKSKSVQEAVKRIGFEEVSRLAGISVARRVSIMRISKYNLSESAYFAGSVGCALLMRQFADTVSGFDENEAYTAGLMSIIGKPALSELLTLNEFEVSWDGSGDLRAWEREHIGFTYSEAGSMLMRLWSFPESICKAVEQHGEVNVQAISSPLAQKLHATTLVIGACDEALQLAEDKIEQKALEWLDLDKDSLSSRVQSSSTYFIGLKNELGLS